MTDVQPEPTGRRHRMWMVPLVSALVVFRVTACGTSGIPTAGTIPAVPASAAPSTALPPRLLPQTAPVPAPAGGNIHQKVAGVVGATATSAPMTRAAVAAAARIGIVDRRLFDFTSGGGVGDVSGPAITVTLRITNGGISALDVSNVSVTVQDAVGSPASPLLGTHAVPFAGSLRARGSAVGSYSFSLPRPSRDPIQIQVSYSATAPTAVFIGGAR